MSNAIDEIEGSDPAAFGWASEGLRRPVKLLGAFEHFAPSDWSLDHLRRTAGSCKLRVYQNDAAGSWYENVEGREGTSVMELPLEEYLDLLGEGRMTDHYAGGLSIDDFPPLRDDARTAPFLECVGHPVPFIVRFWLGRNNATQLHYDLFHTLSVVLIGAKRVTLFPPTDLRRFYPMERPTLRTTSWVRNPRQVLAAEFPEFHHNQPIELSLAAGEILFIPIYWWHFIEGGDAINLSLSYHFGAPSPEDVRSPYLLHYLGLPYERLAR